MLNNTHLVAILATAVSSTCTDPNPGPSTPPNLDSCMIEDGDTQVVDTGDGIAIEGNARIEADTLIVPVGYSGGCEAHEFSLCWPDQSFREQEPVEVGLAVFHNANGDICEAYITEDISLNLRPLRDSYVDAYNRPSGSIVIQLAGTEEPLTYSF